MAISKEAVQMPGLYTRISRREEKPVRDNYIILNHVLKNGKAPTTVADKVKLSRLCIGHIRLIHRHLMLRNCHKL